MLKKTKQNKLESRARTWGYHAGYPVYVVKGEEEVPESLTVMTWWHYGERETKPKSQTCVVRTPGFTQDLSLSREEREA